MSFHWKYLDREPLDSYDFEQNLPCNILFAENVLMLLKIALDAMIPVVDCFPCHFHCRSLLPRLLKQNRCLEAEKELHSEGGTLPGSAGPIPSGWRQWSVCGQDAWRWRTAAHTRIRQDRTVWGKWWKRTSVLWPWVHLALAHSAPPSWLPPFWQQDCSLYHRH